MNQKPAPLILKTSIQFMLQQTWAQNIGDIFVTFAFHIKTRPSSHLTTWLKPTSRTARLLYISTFFNTKCKLCTFHYIKTETEAFDKHGLNEQQTTCTAITHTLKSFGVPKV